jgi:hypothetical protein
LIRFPDDDDGTIGIGGQQTIDFNKTLSMSKGQCPCFLVDHRQPIKPEKVNPAAHFEPRVSNLDTLKRPATQACIAKALTDVFRKQERATRPFSQNAVTSVMRSAQPSRPDELA